MVNKNGKNHICILLSLLLAATLSAVCVSSTLSCDNAFAATTPTLTVETKEVNRGSRFTVNVDISDNQGLVALRFFVGYDKDTVTLADVERGSALGGLPLNYNTDVYPAVVNFAGVVPDKTNGTVLTLVFDSLTDSDAEVAEIDIRVDEQNTLADYKVPQAVNVVGGGVIVKKTDFDYVFVNYDGTELWRKHVAYGTAVPDYEGVTPVRAADSKYTYTFANGWQPRLSDKADEVVFEAVYEQMPQNYKLEFFVAETRDESPQKVDTYTKNYDYGTETVLPNPTKDGYVFVGWFVDKDYKTPFGGDSMPDSNLALYGYFRVAVREQGPTIRMSYGGIDGDNLVVDVNIDSNNGIATMKLSLTFDNDAFTLAGVERGEALANMNLSTSGSFDTAPFTLLWVADENCYDVGVALRLRFAVKQGVANGGYEVALDYNRNSDVTYFDRNKKMAFTAVEINNFTLPVGTVSGWKVTLENLQVIEAATDVAELANVKFDVKLVTDKIVVTDKFADTIGKGNEVKEAYEIRLVADGITVSPGGKLTVKIKLTSRQAMCGNLALYHYADDGEITLVSSKIDNGCIIFETNHLSTWIVVGETANLDEKDCSAWILIVVAAVTAVLCIVAFVTNGVVMRIVGVLWSLASVAVTTCVLLVHTCMYTLMTAALCLLVIVVLLCRLFSKNGIVQSDDGVAYRVKVNKRVDGCYLVHGQQGNFRFDVCDGNNNVLALSAMDFDTIGAVKQGISMCRNNGAVAEFDENADVCPRFTAVRKDGKWYFELLISDNYALLRSVPYSNKKTCIAAIDKVKNSIRSMDVYEADVNK